MKITRRDILKVASYGVSAQVLLQINPVYAQMQVTGFWRPSAFNQFQSTQLLAKALAITAVAYENQTTQIVAKTLATTAVTYENQTTQILTKALATTAVTYENQTTQVIVKVLAT